MTTLEITSCANGLSTCFNANAVGGIGTPQNPVPASQLGIEFAFVFSASPTSTQKHAIFEVAVPLLVTGACSPTACPPAPNTDPAYFYSLHNSQENEPSQHRGLHGVPFRRRQRHFAWQERR